MERLSILTILRLLDERWIENTFTTSETEDCLTINNINDERWHALESDIVPHTSKELTPVRDGDVVKVYFPGAAVIV